MMTVNIRWRDTLSPSMAAVSAQIKPERLAKIAARIAAGVFTAHFEKLSSERHRSGMKHDFYLTAARATSGHAAGNYAIVEVTAPLGLRQRLLGGRIDPVKKYTLRRGNKTVTYSALWIPVGAAVGRTGGDFRGALRVIWNDATKKGVAIDKKTKAVLFALVGSVDQSEDPSVMPPEDDIREGVISGVLEKIVRAWEKKNVE